MNRTKIDWPGLSYSWNPVVGCKHNCDYCYAKKLNDRFKFIPDWENPQFFPERLNDPYKVKKPSTIFVGSMCDLFERWINPDWVYQVIQVCKDNPQHTFMFLTKNHVGYNGFTFPDNCMLGITMTRGDQRYSYDTRQSTPV
jgi:protein gp37